MEITHFNVAVIPNDTHISKWVKEAGTLEIAANWPIGFYRHLIPLNGVVVDVGACIGDHTATYSKLVGSGGTVVAFELNPMAYECLAYNMKQYPNVICFPSGLGENPGMVSIRQDVNAGASSVDIEKPPHEGVFGKIETLDSIARSWSQLDFIKIDVEGFEPFVLEGGRETIRRFKPSMFIEVNEGALRRAGTSRDALFALLGELGYDFIQIVPQTAKITDPQYDILCQAK